MVRYDNQPGSPGTAGYFVYRPLHKRSLPQDGKVVLFHSQLVAIHKTFENNVSTITNGNHDPEDKHCVIRIAKPIWSKLMTETTVLVRTSSSDLMWIDSHPQLSDRRMAMTAAGLMDVNPNRPFMIMIATFSKRPIFFTQTHVGCTRQSNFQMCHPPGGRRTVKHEFKRRSRDFTDIITCCR